MKLKSILGAFAVMFAAAPALADAPLKPFKDQLFAYPRVLQRSDDGTHVTVDYQEMRDINGRDAVPERRVKPDYIATAVRAQQRDLVLNGPGGETITHFATGTRTGARMIVVYLHGQGGSRKQGINDLTFGGNFNRVKNLMAANNGLYLVPDFPDFGDGGAAQVAALVEHYSASSPGAAVFVACGSMGGALCWKLAQDRDVAPLLGGLLLLGSHWDEAFLDSPAFKAGVPVFFGHGSRDRVFPVTKQEAFFRSIRSAKPGYPTRFVRFESGSHGTPIRMVDWRGTLNWMLSLR